jgi:3' exoribonuclease, RNase T-like
MSTTQPDLYISADVETDGPIPGPYSMLSFGLAVVGSYDGHRFERWPSGSETYYRELRPISDRFQDEALAVNGLDRAGLVEQGTPPDQAMEDAAQWVRQQAGDHKAVLVAYPVAFDWSFLYWYFERFATSGSPFGFSSCLDIRTLYQASAGTVHAESGQSAMPASLLPSSPHTHNALDDAIEQGELFANVFEWVARRRDAAMHAPRSAASQAPAWLASRVGSAS